MSLKRFWRIDSFRFSGEEHQQLRRNEGRQPRKSPIKMNKHEVWLDFEISGFDDITHEQLSDQLGLQPFRIYVKGQPKKPGISALSKKNRWLIRGTDDVHVPFEEQMELLLDILEPKIDVISKLSDKYSCEFSLGLYLDVNVNESVPSVHLSKRYARVAAQLNAEFDVDILLVEDEND
jgi:hypothetical protein